MAMPGLPTVLTLRVAAGRISWADSVSKRRGERQAARRYNSHALRLFRGSSIAGQLDPRPTAHEIGIYQENEAMKHALICKSGTEICCSTTEYALE
jgi:hypothetical protein